MKNKLIATAVLACTIPFLAGCQSGPKRLSRTWDDWVNQKYTQDSLIHGALLQDVLPVYPIVGFVMGIGDLFYNAYYFWGKDAWDQRGTGFDHTNPSGTDKRVTGYTD